MVLKKIRTKTPKEESKIVKHTIRLKLFFLQDKPKCLFPKIKELFQKCAELFLQNVENIPKTLCQ